MSAHQHASFTVTWTNGKNVDGVGGWHSAKEAGITCLRHLIEDALVVAGEFADVHAEVLSTRMLAGIRAGAFDLPGYVVKQSENETVLNWSARKFDLDINSDNGLSGISVEDDEASTTIWTPCYLITWPSFRTSPTLY